MIGSSELPAQNKCNGAVGYVCSHQHRADPAVQKKGYLRFDDHDDREVLRIHREEVSRAQLHEQLHRFVVGDEYVDCEKQAWNEAKNQEENKEAGFEQVCESITR